MVLLAAVICASTLIPVSAQELNPDIFRLEINYYLEDTEHPVAPSYQATLPKGETYQVASPIIEGYSLKDRQQAEVEGVLNQNTQIQVFYQYSMEEAAYTIRYIGRSIDGETEVILDTYTGRAPIDSVITAEDKEFSGYIREPSVLSLTVTADGKAQKNLYYSEKKDPCIIFNANGYEVPIISEKPGTDISEQIEKLPTPTREGYTFGGWDVEKLPSVMPEEDLIINATWNPGECSYTVLYWFQNIENDDYTLNYGENHTRRGITGETVTANEEDIALGETNAGGTTFYGFDYSHADEVVLAGDGSSVLNVYYDREIWTINLYDNPLYDETTKGEYQNMNRKLWKSFSGKYGSSTAGVLPSLDEIEQHYTADGAQSFGENYNYINLCIADKTDFEDSGLITGTVTYFTADTFTQEGIENTHSIDLFPFYSTKNQRAFHISVFGQALENPEEYELLTQMVKVGKAGTPTWLTLYPIKGFTNEGGAYRADYNLSGKDWISNDADVVEKKPDGSYKFHVYDWCEFRQQRVKNTLTFMSGDEIVKSEENIYYETSLDERLEFIPENADSDVKFGGWYLNPDSFNLIEPVTSYKMPETDLTFYAKWIPVDFQVSFDSNGGSEIESQTISKGKCAVIPEAPTRENYTFGGWYTSDGVRWNFDKQITGDITLYALWKPIPAVYGYQVKHILRADNSPIAVHSGQGFVGDTVVVQALNARNEEYVEGSYIVPDALTKSITLTTDGSNIVVFYYDIPDLEDYTVSYLLKGTEKALRDDKTVKDTKLSRVTEIAEVIEGYTPTEKYKISDLTVNGENRIIFYYEENDGASLTVSKSVTGKLGDKDKAFTIQITLLDEDNKPVEVSFPVSGPGYGEGEQISFDTEGKTEIRLKDGQSVQISNLEAGNQFKVQEISVPAGYEVTYNNRADEDGIQGKLEEETQVSIVNHREEIPVTSINDENRKVFLLILVISSCTLLSGLCGAVIRRQRKSR